MFFYNEIFLLFPDVLLLLSDVPFLFGADKRVSGGGQFLGIVCQYFSRTENDFADKDDCLGRRANRR